MAPYISLASTLLGMCVVREVMGAEAAFKPPINNTLEKGVETECKTCPYSLCTNKAFYEYDTQVTLLCWTRGTEIGGDTTWLRTSDDCYVTQYDLTEYSGEYETDLSYCGKASEEEHLTYAEATVKYDSECNICPDNASCETIKYQKPDTDLTVTCWTDDGGAVIDDTTWVKTTDNCYVNELHLEEAANKDILDNCGPIGFLQVNYTDTEAASVQANQLIAKPKSKAIKTNGLARWSRVPKRSPDPAPAPIPLPEPLAEASSALHKRYLINITVGEDYAVCHQTATSASKVVTRYPFGEGVWMQCYETVDTATNPNETYWYKTTDFCYVREVDFFESLFDQYRFPACSLFE